jgi:hypothetical protein
MGIVRESCEYTTHASDDTSYQWYEPGTRRQGGMHSHACLIGMVWHVYLFLSYSSSGVRLTPRAQQ